MALAPSGSPSRTTAFKTAGPFRAILAVLIADADHQSVDVGGLELLAQLVELIELGDGTDAHAMPHVRIDSDALNGRLDSLQCELRTDPIRVRLIAVRPGLQHIDARAF